MFIDTHAHLTDEHFQEDVENILNKMRDVGVEKVITSGFDVFSSQEAVQFAEKHDGVFASIGVYPCECDKVGKDYIEKLRELAKNERVVAIGEIGLEKREGAPDLESQKKCFLEQIKLAYEVQKPIVIHCREAIGEMLSFLREHKDLLKFGGTFHCFGGSKEVAREILDLGYHISLGGVSTFKNARAVKEAILTIPLEKILLETDCPYLAPEPFRGKRNDPSFLPYIAENIAKIKGVSVEEVGRVTTGNARRLFGI